jgi:DNA-binding MarR family transcriptional regulator
MIEAELSPSGEPVLGLYLHVAYMTVIASFAGQVGQGDITPNLIGVLALVARAPGTNQAELARVVGLEPATVGQQVSRAVERGLVRREHSPTDKRSYTLRLTPRGEAMLKTLRRRIPPHENMIGRKLSPAERRQLRGLLDKLVYG